MQYYDAPPSARTMWASAPKLFQVGTVRAVEIDRMDIGSARTPSTVPRPTELIGTAVGIEYRPLSNNPSTNTLHEQRSLSKDPSAQTIVDHLSLSKISSAKTLVERPTSINSPSQMMFNNSPFQLPLGVLPIAPGAVEEAMSQVSTARVSTAMSHGTRIPPKVPYIPPPRYQRNGRNTPVRGSNCSPAPQSRSTRIADSKLRVCTAHDVDVRVNRIDAELNSKHCTVCGKFMLDSNPKKLDLDTSEKREKALGNLRMQASTVDAARLALRDAERADVCEKELQKYRGKLAEMEKEVKLEKSRGEIRIRKAFEELTAMRSENDALKKDNKELKISKSEWETTTRTNNQKLAAVEKQFEEHVVNQALQKQHVEREADKHALQIQVDEIKLRTDCKYTDLANDNRILREREKESMHNAEQARRQKESMLQKIDEKKHDAKLITDVQKQQQDSEAVRQELAVQIARAEAKVKVTDSSTLRPAEMANLMRGENRSYANLETLKSHMSKLEMLHEMNKAHHHLLWSFIPKESETILKQRLLELRDTGT